MYYYKHIYVLIYIFSALFNLFHQDFVFLSSLSCLTLFFHIANFSDRIMVSLTVMMVVATLLSTIQVYNFSIMA